MSKRLVKVAKELNVGTGSIVDFLAKKGFEIDNRPTARVSEEMYNLLVQEFQSSMALKEQADQLVIGTSRQIQERSEERRVGKECRTRGAKDHERIKAVHYQEDRRDR